MTTTLPPGLEESAGESRAAPARPAPDPYGVPALDVVVPVHNEEADVAASVRRLHAHLTAGFPYRFRITVADNASTDGTLAVAERLAAELPEVRAVHLAEKGRGRALRAVWSTSDAPVLAYMDVDLSTDLAALAPLVAPLLSGHSDLAIGTRLHRGSRVVRGAKREFISRCYNLLLRGTLAARFSDAQCGFKAIRADVAAGLLPLVEDERLVLRHRAAGAGRARRAAHPRGAGGLGGRPGQPGRHRRDRARRPARASPGWPARWLTGAAAGGPAARAARPGAAGAGHRRGCRPG